MSFDPSAGLPGLVYFLVGIMNMVIPVLVAASLVLFMIGAVKYIYSEGEHENRSIMLWSLVALFVMLSMWGILRLMCSTLTQSASCNSATNYNADSGLYKKSGPPAGRGIYPI